MLHLAYLAICGLILGNLVGITLLLIQKYLSPITLDPSIYFVNKAPIDIDVLTIFNLNISTFIICITVLIIPSYLIAKISPVKAIKFDS